MKITKTAVAGTLESSDAQVRIMPSDSLDIEINSSVEKQFGEQILATVQEVLTQLGVGSAQVIVEDKGALDCVLRARVKAAVTRAVEDEINWSVLL